jgi:hypothetical protein
VDNLIAQILCYCGKALFSAFYNAPCPIPIGNRLVPGFFGAASRPISFRHLDLLISFFPLHVGINFLFNERFNFRSLSRAFNQL